MVSWNSSGHCLRSNIPEPDVLDGDQWRFPVERIENTAPKGFGANHNQAFARCDTDWFLVLNPDIRLDDDVLTRLIEHASPESGLLTPRIFEPGKSSPEPHRNLITPFEIIGRKKKNYQPPTSPRWIPGLFMLYRSTAYADVEGFDEKKFFMYGEDFDICARLILEGWRLDAIESISAFHDARRASHASGRHFYWHLTSLFKIWTSFAFWKYRRAIRRNAAFNRS
jgi:GT2 family glycosyltransferase